MFRLMIRCLQNPDRGDLEELPSQEGWFTLAG